MLKDRSKSVLEASIRDFIKTGKPVTSESLYERYDFGIKPAMIRWELNFLCEEGFLYQTHPSGGRFPTDKAYRFLIKELLKEEPKELPVNGYFADLVYEFLEGRRDSLIEELAGYLKILSVGYEPETDRFVRSGFKDMVLNLDIINRDELLEVVSDFESLPERLTRKVRQWRKESFWPQVFVGRSPITKSSKLAVMIERLRPADQDLFIIAIGPKRMDYEKSLRLLRSLKRIS